MIDDLVSVVPLAAGAAGWGVESLRKLGRKHISRPDALERIEASPFSLAAGTANVMALYEGLPVR